MTRPRIRSIKPEMWADEKLGKLTRDERLLFVGLITMADDEGRLRAMPTAILGHCLPYDNDAPRKLERWLKSLAVVSLVYRYEHAGMPYIQLVGWSKHQKINRGKPSDLPPPSGKNVVQMRRDVA